MLGYDNMRPFCDGLAAVCRDGKWGFINADREEVISLQYDCVGDFYNGLAKIEKYEDDFGIVHKTGFLDKKGSIVIPLIYDDVYDFKEPVSPFRIDSDVDYVDAGSEDYHVDVPCRVGGKWGLINTKGEVVLEAKYDRISPIVDNRAPFNIGGHYEKLGGCCLLVGGKWGVIDGDGYEIVPPKYDRISCFKDMFAVVNIGGCWQEVQVIQNGRRTTSIAYIGGKYTLIDHNGDELCKPIYDWIDYFHDGIARVNIGGDWNDDYSEFVGGKWGFIDMSGKEIITPKYTAAENFKDGIALVEYDFSYGGYINKLGQLDVSQNIGVELWISEKYDWGYVCQNGLIAVSLKGKWGYINESGAVVIPIIFDEVGDFKDGKSDVILNGKNVTIDESGNVLKEFSRIEPSTYRRVDDYNNENSYNEEHYGRYAGNYVQDDEGYSDDEIDSIFGGEPDAYWNID